MPVFGFWYTLLNPESPAGCRANRKKGQQYRSNRSPDCPVTLSQSRNCLKGCGNGKRGGWKKWLHERKKEKRQTGHRRCRRWGWGEQREYSSHCSKVKWRRVWWFLTHSVRELDGFYCLRLGARPETYTGIWPILRSAQSHTSREVLYTVYSSLQYNIYM